MTSYIQLLDKIETFCNDHIQIQKFGGEFKEQMPNFATQNEKYPIIFVVPTSDTEGLELNQFTLDVYCLDIIQKDRANLNTILSDCHLILKDMYLYFKDGDDLSVEVIADPSMTPLNNFDLDYVAGWVMSITFEVEGYSVCAIPLNPTPAPPSTCPAADYEITDDSLNVLYSGTVASGGTLNQTIQDSTVVIKDDSANILHTVSVNAEGSVDQVISDSTAVIKDDSNNTLYTLSINAEGSANQVISDSTVTINNSAATLLHSVSVNAQGTATQVISDSSVGNSDASYSVNVVAEGSLVLPDSQVNVNSVNEGNVVSVKTIDINVTDSLGAVTPDSVSIVGNTITIDVPDAPTTINHSTATLMKTGQTTSYRTGDDGDLEAGRATDFTTLDAAPLHTNGAATLNTTTARFTDTAGGSTYANDWVLDWSTWDGSTILGYYRVIQGGAAANWNTAIDNSLGTFGGYSGCRLPNVKEMYNIMDNGTNPSTNYTPFSHASTAYWTSTTTANSTTSALRIGSTGATAQQTTKTTASYSYIPVRTFSLSTSNVLS